MSVAYFRGLFTDQNFKDGVLVAPPLNVLNQETARKPREG